ncbi:transposase [Salmonella enterica]|nr:transposase [Salmonella enterica subsp. enterica]EBS6880847.1 transposase [Salmonella enterica]
MNTQKKTPIKSLAGAIRSHREVENKVHWVLDVTFSEDDNCIRAGDGAENVAVIRRSALNLARLHPQKDSMRSKLKQACWSDKFRNEIVSKKGVILMVNISVRSDSLPVARLQGQVFKSSKLIYFSPLLFRINSSESHLSAPAHYFHSTKYHSLNRGPPE